jgi:hypothetical protein
MPPGQVLLHLDSQDLQYSDFALEEDNNLKAQPVMATLVLSEATTVTLRQLEQILGTATETNEDRPNPAPAALVSFPEIRDHPTTAVSVLVQARVDRPVAKTSKVRTLTLVRSDL